MLRDGSSPVQGYTSCFLFLSPSLPLLSHLSLCHIIGAASCDLKVDNCLAPITENPNMPSKFHPVVPCYLPPSSILYPSPSPSIVLCLTSIKILCIFPVSPPPGILPLCLLPPPSSSLKRHGRLRSISRIPLPHPPPCLPPHQGSHPPCHHRVFFALEHPW